MKTIIKKLSYLLLAAIVLSVASLQSCDPDKPDAPEEAALVISLNPDANSTTPVVTMGTTYTFSVNVASTLPAQGVDVAVVYKEDSDPAVLFSQNYTITSTAPLSVTVTGIPFNKVGTVSVAAVSRSKPSNTALRTFKLIKK